MSCMKTFNMGNSYSVFTVTTFLPPYFLCNFPSEKLPWIYTNENTVGFNPLHTELKKIGRNLQHQQGNMLGFSLTYLLMTLTTDHWKHTVSASCDFTSRTRVIGSKESFHCIALSSKSLSFTGNTVGLCWLKGLLMCFSAPLSLLLVYFLCSFSGIFVFILCTVSFGIIPAGALIFLLPQGWSHPNPSEQTALLLDFF